MNLENDLFGFADGAKEFHLLFDLGLDSLEARLEKFAGVIALAGIGGRRIGLAGSAVVDGCLSEDELAVGVDVDFAHTTLDGSADLIIGDASAAMEN